MDIYRKENSKIILGKSIPVFIFNLGYHLVDLKIYQDGMIDCWELISFKEFKKKIESGWVRTSMENGSELSIFPLGNLKCESFNQLIKETELIKEVEDVINELNGKLTTLKICQKLFKEYIKNPTEENKTKLKEAYENIPKHNRIYVLGDMDVDDIPIRIIIYGEESERDNRKLMLFKEKIGKYLKEGVSNE
jgi:hypothetical protein